MAACSAATSPADGFENEKSGPLMLLAPAWMAASMTVPTIAAGDVIDIDSLAVPRRISRLWGLGPTRILPQLVSTDSVWIPDAGTPAPRTAPTIAATRRFVADSAGGAV